MAIVDVDLCKIWKDVWLIRKGQTGGRIYPVIELRFWTKLFCSNPSKISVNNKAGTWPIVVNRTSVPGCAGVLGCERARELTSKGLWNPLSCSMFAFSSVDKKRVTLLIRDSLLISLGLGLYQQRDSWQRNNGRRTASRFAMTSRLVSCVTERNETSRDLVVLLFIRH